MTRDTRIQSAKQWLQTYTGKNIIRGYCKWFGVDSLAAVIELRQLGVPITAAKEMEERRKAVSRSTADKAMKLEETPDSDGTFAFIAGYTPAGFPYGITWEEFEEADKKDEVNKFLHGIAAKRGKP
jgi:hypothetical protein